ncbi:MAG: hypothetical protein R3F60_27680 [bacterium]
MLAHHVAEDVLREARRPDAARLQEDQPVGQALGLLHVVGGQHHRHARRAQARHQLPDRDARLGIEAGGGLVEEDHPGPVQHRPRDHQAPLVAAGQGLGLVIGELHQAELVEDLVDAARQIPDARPEVARGLGEVALHGEVAVEGVILGADAQDPAGGVGRPGQVVAVDPHHAGVGAQEAVAHAQRRRLAGAVGPEQAEHLAGRAGEIHAVHHAAAPRAFTRPRASSRESWASLGDERRAWSRVPTPTASIAEPAGGVSAQPCCRRPGGDR